MELISFESAVVAISRGDELVIALMDGDGRRRCVAILACRAEAAKALCAGVGSALKTPTE